MSWITKLDKVLAGWPDTTLTLLLIGLAGVALAAAFAGKPALKASIAAWFLFP